MKEKSVLPVEVCLDVSAAIGETAGIARYSRQLGQELVKLELEKPVSGVPLDYRLFYNRQPPPPNALNAAGEGLNGLSPALRGLPLRSVNLDNRQWRMLLQMAHRLPAPVQALFDFDRKVFGAGTGRRIYHGLSFIAPPFRQTASVITIYDLSFLLYPHLHTRLNRLNLRTLVPLCANKAARIIVISQSTRQDLIRWLGPEIGPKTRVIYPGVSEAFFQPPDLEVRRAVRASYALDDERPLILQVSTIEPRKNQSCVVRALAELLHEWPFAQARPRLVLVGKIGWGEEYNRVVEECRRAGLSFAKIGRAEDKPPHRPDVSLLTDLKDEALRNLYAEAAIVVYPSLYEGFGLPALEALAAGVPLIATNNSSLPEITGPDGETALLIDPTEAEIGSLVRAMRTLLNDTELAARLRLAGQSRARTFSWARTAQETRAVYEEVASTL